MGHDRRATGVPRAGVHSPYDAVMRPLRDPQFRRAVLIVLAVVGWTGVAWIGILLASMSPPRAGDDLQLLLDAAGRLVAGEPLYVTVPAEGSLQAENLFYSYPPPVAQALVPLVGVPLEVVLVSWGLGAVAGLALVGTRLAGPGPDRALAIVALAPYVAPFAVALLFGNVNAWFPFLFGLVLLAVLAGGRGPVAAGGIALAVATAAKIHPASLGLWLLVRGARRHDAREPSVALAAVAVGLAILAVSLLAWGIDPWLAWVDFLRSGAATTDLVNRLNVGPASQLALLLGLDGAAARSIQVVVTVAALVGTVVAAGLVRDPVASFAWAVVASLVVLPVTWVHYPVALIPVAIAALARVPAERRAIVVGLMGGVIAVGMIAVAVPVTIWIAVGLVLASAHVAVGSQLGRQASQVPKVGTGR